MDMKRILQQRELFKVIKAKESEEGLEHRLYQLKASFDLLLELTEDLCRLQDDPDFVDPSIDFGEYEDKYYETYSLLAVATRGLRARDANPTPAGGEQLDRSKSDARGRDENSGLHFERIKIATFTGKFEDWVPFRDLFSGAVDKQANLSKCQKFHYLKSYLGGEALGLIKHIAVTNDNYDKAREKLEQSAGDKIVGNPIGWLQEMCMQRRWPPPSYETETEVGLPHERLFTIACTILNYREVGKGKSKKIAKRLAAHKMWTRLQETPIDAAKINDSICSELEAEPRNSDNYYGDLKDISVPTLTTQHSNKVSQFHKTLKNATGKKLLKLQKTCLKSSKLDYIKLLSEIAAENQFEVTYVDIEEKTFSGQFQCLVQLSTLPVGVCHGTGPTAQEAQRHAAQNALEYLKIMTKK